VLSDEPWPEIVDVSRRIASYDSYRFSLVVGRLRMNRDGTEEKQNDQ